MGSLLNLKVRIKFWLETENGYVFGEGVFKILSKVEELGTLRGAAETLDMSYRHAWGMIKKSEQRIGKPLLKTHKGGKLGGGGAKLTEEAKLLIDKYLDVKEMLKKIDETFEFI